MKTWVIGAGGLFGSALARISTDTYIASSIPWSDTAEALAVLESALAEFTASCSTDWCIFWAAGYATTSSTQAEADRELSLFAAFIDVLRNNPPPGRGVFALTSSAGGIYGGSSCPPFTSNTLPAPLGTYGNLKLAQETAAKKLNPEIPVLIARVANIYGPGQDLTKLQGIVSHLALAAITKKPVNIFVSLETLRDYVYVDDAAQQALHWAAEALQTRDSATRIIGSGRPETLGHIIALMSDITRTRIPIASGFDASATHQTIDLRLIPDIDHCTKQLPITQLPDGMKRVYLDIAARHAEAALTG
jgi:UDP-glucose 4-epimerase